MGKLFYIIFIKLYPVSVKIASLFSLKAKLWVKGRQDIFAFIGNKLRNETRKRIWMHCSSLGEFEQGKPLIELLKKNYPHYSYIITFFSPSGYENEKNNPVASHIFYLPVDSLKNASRFYETVQPLLVIFVKYEFWYYYLKEAKKRNIPLLLISAIFRQTQPFFKWYGKFYRQMIKCFSHVFVQTDRSLKLLNSIGVHNVSISGDTRFDRVIEIAQHFKPVAGIEDFCKNRNVIVAGSTWIEDDEELDHYVNTHQDYRFIIAPHNIGEARLQECEKLYQHSIRYSEYLKNVPGKAVHNFNTIIIDNIGMLKYLYAYGTICYIGGGFGGDGVHNITEAAVFGKPVVFGPVYEKYAEAVELVQLHGAFSIADALELEATFNDLLTNKNLCSNTSVIAGNFVRSKAGATENIIKYIQENRLLTS